MRYLGSKGRIANKLLPIILKDRQPGQFYVELFCGGCNMIDKVENPRIAADVNPLLIAMWEDFQVGREFPISISKDDYDTAYASYKSGYYGVMDMALVCWIGFNASFRGKFFAGYSGTKTSEHIDGAVANIMRQAEKLNGVEFRCGSYRSVPIPECSIVYLDPPYRDTTGYCTGAFDYDDFYNFCFELWEQGHTVFISEYNMPDPFKEVLSIELRVGIKAGKTGIEKLYTL